GRGPPGLPPAARVARVRGRHLPLPPAPVSSRAARMGAQRRLGGDRGVRLVRAVPGVAEDPASDRPVRILSVEIFHGVLYGFQVALQPINLLYCFAGVFIGTLVGVLPGLGPAAAIALLLPSTFAASP